MILLQQLTKRFGTQTAVDALSFEIPAGQIVGFLGPNGAGKSTTLKMLTGMLEPTSGSASICGFDLQTQSIEVKRHVGFVPESGAVFESLSGLEYLEMIAALYGIPKDAARARIQQFIAFFDLSFETLTDKLLGAYSKGMRRKVVITAALLHNPRVVFSMNRSMASTRMPRSVSRRSFRRSRARAKRLFTARTSWTWSNAFAIGSLSSTRENFCSTGSRTNWWRRITRERWNICSRD